MSDILNKMWPVDRVFTVTFSIKDEGGANQFLDAMYDNDNLFNGCEIVRIYPKDYTEESRVKTEEVCKFISNINTDFEKLLEKIG